MAIDPKELRIGSHVFFKKKRIKIVGIPSPNVYDNMSRDIYWRSEDDSHYIGVDCADERLTPIPITEELLMEIGFEKHEIHGRDVFRRLYKDTPLGKMYYVVNYNPNAEVWNFCVHPTATEVKYLHELECMAYLATKQELIND